MRRRALELATFAALAWYAGGHWAGLLADAPSARVFACVVIASAVAVALIVLRGSRGLPVTLLRVACVAAGFAAGAVAIGLERRMLAPAHWDEFGEGLDRGFAALGSASWPYDGADSWAELVLLLAIPLVLTSAAALAFWGGRNLRPLALVLLLALYGVAVTEHEFQGELGRGVMLLLLVAAWLWLPAMPERGARTALVAAAAVLLACVIALPAAARYRERDGWLDYESWNPFDAHAGTQFDWFHSYGPIDWPRDGTTLMYVRSSTRHYWRVETLDRFDGFRWVRSGMGRDGAPLIPAPHNPAWETTFRVTIADLDTELFPVAGTPLEFSGDGIPAPDAGADGTVETGGDPLDKGDVYRVRAYLPDPDPAELRAASIEAPAEVRLPNTEVLLPPPGATATSGFGSAGDAARSAAEAAIAPPASIPEIGRSPYARTLRLARRLARGRATPYDVVLAIQRHLRSRYTYSEDPPLRSYPLAAFLFRDRVGYCQQFSGAMALMLRMLGIPARVAAGFSPGSYNADTKEFRVRDLDAHSWVEVWFDGIGWVPFDPTPAIAPARSQSGFDDASASGGSGARPEQPDPVRGGNAPAIDAGSGSASERDSGGGLGPVWLVVAALVLLVLVAARRALVLLRRRARPQTESEELARLVRALRRLGEPVPPRLTLRELERRLTRRAGAPAARYVLMVRERRYAARGAGPDAAARRDLRLALGRGRGLRGRALAYISLPPASFRRG